jgi:hypothetical protein
MMFSLAFLFGFDFSIYSNIINRLENVDIAQLILETFMKYKLIISLFSVTFIGNVFNAVRYVDTHIETHADPAGFEVLTALLMKSAMLWHILLYGPFKVNRRFGEICNLDLRVRRIIEARSRH